VWKSDKVVVPLKPGNARTLTSRAFSKQTWTLQAQPLRSRRVNHSDIRYSAALSILATFWVGSHGQQGLAIDLAERVSGEFVHNVQPFRDLVVSKPRLRIGENVIEPRCAVCQTDQTHDTLTEDCIWNANDSSVTHSGMSHQDTLDFDWRDVRTAANDQILLARDELELVVFSFLHEITCVEPAAGRGADRTRP
jgi:hypothetical protein